MDSKNLLKDSKAYYEDNNYYEIFSIAEDGENEQEYKGNHHKIHNGLSIPVLLITVVVIIVIISVLPIIRFERISIFVVIRSLVFHLVLRILSLATYSSLII